MMNASGDTQTRLCTTGTQASSPDVTSNDDHAPNSAQRVNEATRTENVSFEMATGTGIERVLQRIRNQIESGSYYEAQQSYKTVYHRFKAKNLLQDSYRVLEEGACLQLEKGQINCGIELGTLLLEAYEEGQMELEEAQMAAFRRMVLLLPSREGAPHLHQNSAEVEEGSRFVDSIIRFLKKRDLTHVWYYEFNGLAGDYVFNWEGWASLGRITVYYARGQNWSHLTQVIGECLESANASEEDLFICRAVLQILLYSLYEPVSAAGGFLKYYTEHRTVSQTPLLNFTHFLIEIPSERLVEMLKVKYASELNRDKHLENLLAKVGSKLFPRRSNNMISNLLDGLLGSTPAAT